MKNFFISRERELCVLTVRRYLDESELFTWKMNEIFIKLHFNYQTFFRLLIFVLVPTFFYFALLRPQKKNVKERACNTCVIIKLELLT